MDNFSPGHQDANFEQDPMPGISDPFDALHADDNLGDEAAFPSTWQHMALRDGPND